MLTKLQALHPLYSLSLHKRRYGGVVFLALDSDAPTLWADYCELFEESSKLVTYANWVKAFDTLTDHKRAFLHKQMARFKHKPLISVVMPVYNPNPEWLEAAILSVRAQLYPHWELCIADDASTDPAIRPLLTRLSQLDRRIKIEFRAQNGHICAASNSALALAQGAWVALLDHDDSLPEHALFWVVDAINRHPECRLFYSDEDKLDEQGQRADAYFKCDWNPDLFYSQNMFSHLGVYDAQLLRTVGGFRAGFEGSQDYDLALRCIEHIGTHQVHHIPRVLYHWRIHLDSTAHSTDAKPYAMLAGERAINGHLARRGVDAQAEFVGYGYRVRYALPKTLPLVSLIIPTRNGLALLKACLKSIFAKTTYPHYEVLVIDNGSDDPATLRFLKKLAAKPQVRVLRDEGPFNYSALNNAAVKVARGEIIGLINNDIEVISPDWLSEMVSHALRPEVGAVGAKLLYDDNTVQHAGIILGIHGVAGHAHSFLPRDDLGYFCRARILQSFSAVTGACLLVRKALYDAVGGLNESELQVAFNDVDFCLKLLELGYRNVWTPYAELYHHESATRGLDDTHEKQVRFLKEIDYMKQRWGKLLQNDPAYSPNLTLAAEDFSLAWPPRLADMMGDEL
ncbi:MAG: glycosyltransferase family 2 protein [Methylococcaceae bacterium]|nr:glycosyltransferase family 2 protein [Methylococcaceae bacterium]